MNLQDALQETGCAIYWEAGCVISVERLPDSTYLLMRRQECMIEERGTSILQSLIVTWEDFEQVELPTTWQPARVYFTEERYTAMELPAIGKE